MGKTLKEAFTNGKKTVTLRGKEVSYREKGIGLSVLILAGWGGPTVQYFQLQNKLAASGYRVFLPDLSGISATGYLSLQDWPDWIEEFNRVSIGEPCVILAHSLSARAALLYLSKAHSHALGCIIWCPWLVSFRFEAILFKAWASAVRYLCPIVYPNMQWVRENPAWATALELISPAGEQPAGPALILVGKSDVARYLFRGWKKIRCEVQEHNWDHSPQIRKTDELVTVIDRFIRQAIHPV